LKEEERAMNFKARTELNSTKERDFDETIRLISRKKTLREKIDLALDEYIVKDRSKMTQTYEKLASTCLCVRDSSVFQMLIISAIFLSISLIAYQTNYEMKCMISAKRTNSSGTLCSSQNNELNLLVQAIFTLEILVKVVAEEGKPLRFFYDREKGTWNSVDFMITMFGFVEVANIFSSNSPFKSSPVYVIRIFRLIRVARLVRQLPQLQLCVEALVTSFSSIFWIVALVLIFNYSAASFFTLLFRENDVFHWGSLSKGMLTMVQIETLVSMNVMHLCLAVNS
jgi:hypothetical protein